MPIRRVGKAVKRAARTAKVMGRRKVRRYADASLTRDIKGAKKSKYASVRKVGADMEKMRSTPKGRKKMRRARAAGHATIAAGAAAGTVAVGSKIKNRKKKKTARRRR